jgi:DNA-binding IclR family transcriptional regulator
MTDGLVKSAARALDILDAFATKRQPMTATEIGTALGYPKSSMSMLLRSLVAQGYLSLSGREQTYFPTLKVARLGDWVAGALIGSEKLLEVLEELRDATGETITLTGALDLQMRCLHALIGTHPIALQVEEGVRFPMLGTAIGAAWLAAQADEQVNDYLARWKKVEKASAEQLNWIASAVELTRSVGHATAYNAVIPDTGAVAMAVRPGNEDVLVVATAGLNSRIQAKEGEIISLMQQLLSPFKI